MVPALRDPKLHPFVGTDVGEVTGRAAHSSGGDTFSSLYADEADAPLRPADPDLSVGIQYTSGTTSRPKSVVWTHANALWGGKMCAVHEQLRPEDVHLAMLPLFHTNAQSCESQLRFSERRST